MSGRLRFQLLDLVELCNKSCCFVIFTGHPSVSQGMSNPNYLFDLANICVATVDAITDLGDGRDNGLVGGRVVSKGDCRLHPAKGCLNWGTSMWNCWYGGCNDFLIGVIELTGSGFVRVWEVTVSDADEGCGHQVLYT